MGHPNINHGTEAALVHRQPAEVPENEEQLQLLIHIPEYLHTTPEDMGPKVERIIQKHDKAATLDDSNTGGTTHQIQIIRDIQGQWNGSFKYTAQSQELAEKLQLEMNYRCLSTEFCQSRPITERHTDPRFLTPPPDDPRAKNAERRGGTAAPSPPSNEPPLPCEGSSAERHPPKLVTPGTLQKAQI